MNHSITPDEKQLIFKLHRETAKGLFLCKKILVKTDWNYEKSKIEIEKINDRLILY
jgi:translation elongation factor EF-Ts